MKTKIANSAIPLDCSNREALIKANSVLISQLQARLKAKRFRPQEGDTCKLGYIRALIQALQAQNSILADFELTELKKEIDELKELVRCKQRE